MSYLVPCPEFDSAPSKASYMAKRSSRGGEHCRLVKGIDTWRHDSLGGITLTIFHTFEFSITFLK